MDSQRPEITYRPYKSEDDLPVIMELIQKDLSEPYSVYTYRYFIYNWPQLCFMAYDDANGKIVGTIICRLTQHKSGTRRGYIGMIAVHEDYRKLGIGSQLVEQGIIAMQSYEADEVVLETEVSNTAAQRLYLRLGFVIDKYLNRYYLTGADAIRLKLWLK